MESGKAFEHRRRAEGEGVTVNNYFWRDCLWVVEECYDGEWIAWACNVVSTRSRARKLQKQIEFDDVGRKTRIRKYVRLNEGSPQSKKGSHNG